MKIITVQHCFCFGSLVSGNSDVLLFFWADCRHTVVFLGLMRGSSRFWLFSSTLCQSRDGRFKCPKYRLYLRSDAKVSKIFDIVYSCGNSMMVLVPTRTKRLTLTPTPPDGVGMLDTAHVRQKVDWRRPSTYSKLVPFSVQFSFILYICSTRRKKHPDGHYQTYFHFQFCCLFHLLCATLIISGRP